MECSALIFSGHAVQRMFERQIGEEDVCLVVRLGDVIADYPDDTPYPSCLLLSCVEGRAIHVVVAVDSAKQQCYVVTVYEPDPARWQPDFRTRRIP